MFAALYNYCVYILTNVFAFSMKASEVKIAFIIAQKEIM